MTDTPTQPDDLEAEVERLLPRGGYDHYNASPERARLRVLAALRKQREVIAGLVNSKRALDKTVEQLSWEANQADDDREFMHDRIADLERQLAEAEAERDAARAQALADRAFQSENARLAARLAHLEAALAKVVGSAAEYLAGVRVADWVDEEEQFAAVVKEAQQALAAMGGTKP